MSIRSRLARLLLQLGAFIQSLPIVIMTPDDLVAFSRQTYGKPADLESWSEEPFVDQGLSPDELELINALPKTDGKLLLLGVGGGREAIPFARMGFHVTGVDYIQAMVERAIQNAEKRGVHIEGLVQEISKLDVPEDVFDVVWISRSMYSCVPTRSRRVKMVRLIYQTLKPGGILICQFKSGLSWQTGGKGERLRRVIAASPFGNRHYEIGDILWLNREFIHIFMSENEIRSELESGGFIINKFDINSNSTRGGAICLKTPKGNNQTTHEDDE